MIYLKMIGMWTLEGFENNNNALYTANHFPLPSPPHPLPPTSNLSMALTLQGGSPGKIPLAVKNAVYLIIISMNKCYNNIIIISEHK